MPGAVSTTYRRPASPASFRASRPCPVPGSMWPAVGCRTSFRTAMSRGRARPPCRPASGFRGATTGPGAASVHPPPEEAPWPRVDPTNRTGRTGTSPTSPSPRPPANPSKAKAWKTARPRAAIATRMSIRPGRKATTRATWPGRLSRAGFRRSRRSRSVPLATDAGGRSRPKPLLQGRSRQSAQREVVGRVRVGFRLERVVPPLVGVVGEALRLHRVAQQVAVAALGVGDAGRVGMGQLAEVVEAGAHVQRRAVFAPVIALPQGQVQRRATAVAGMLSDVLPHQRVLAEQRIELRLVLLVVGIAHPAHEVLHGAHRAIAVEDLKAPVLRAKPLLHAPQRLGH